MKQKLKPCPFCGKSNSVGLSERKGYSPSKPYQIICDAHIDGCGASTGYSKTIDDCVFLWNTRADHFPEVKKKVDHITTDNSKVNINLLEENERLKNEVASLKEALGLAHTLEPREEVDWEQRRYELVKIFLAKFDTDDFKPTTKREYIDRRGWEDISRPPIAETQSIYMADKLIKQLKQQNNE